jgi:hypothetical protein
MSLVIASGLALFGCREVEKGAVELSDMGLIAAPLRYECVSLAIQSVLGILGLVTGLAFLRLRKWALVTVEWLVLVGSVCSGAWIVIVVAEMKSLPYVPTGVLMGVALVQELVVLGLGGSVWRFLRRPTTRQEFG